MFSTCGCQDSNNIWMDFCSSLESCDPTAHLNLKHHHYIIVMKHVMTSESVIYFCIFQGRWQELLLITRSVPIIILLVCISFCRFSFMLATFVALLNSVTSRRSFSVPPYKPMFRLFERKSPC